MPAHKQVLQSIKKKKIYKGPNIPKGKSCMKMPTALRPQTWLLQVSGCRFMVCEYFQFLAWPREEIFSMALPCIPTSSCNKAKALQSRELLQHWYWWPRGFLRQSKGLPRMRISRKVVKFHTEDKTTCYFWSINCSHFSQSQKWGCFLPNQDYQH